jgi:predicted aminopeptidase
VCGAALTALFLCGCQTAHFYRQAACGQWEMLSRQRPISDVLLSANADSRLKMKLTLALEIREFAQTNLQLTVGNHYLHYADLGRPYAVWNVCAAPELSLQPKTWSFPIIGAASYRGYFSERDAVDYARSLKRDGLEVCVGGVETYSTLGWFRDPILNTFINDPETDLAEVLFHELAHQKLFVPGDSDFNEAFATAVAQEGLRRWFEREQRPELFARYQAEARQQRVFTDLILETIQKLDSVYNDISLSKETKRARKAEIIQELRSKHQSMKEQWGGESPFDGWVQSPINNAKLGTVATYYGLVPAFEALLKTNGGDLPRFYAAVKDISKLPRSAREARLWSYVRK